MRNHDEPYYGPPPDSDSDESYEGFYFGDDVSIWFSCESFVLDLHFFSLFSTLIRKPIKEL